MSAALSTTVYRYRSPLGGWQWQGEVRQNGQHVHGTATHATRADATAAVAALLQVLQHALDAGVYAVWLSLSIDGGTVLVEMSSEAVTA
jgi:hypothetical protein